MDVVLSWTSARGAWGGGGWVNGHLGIVFPWMVGRSTLLLWGSGVSMDGREINAIAMGEWCFHGR